MSIISNTNNISYTSAWQYCDCGSKIKFNANLPGCIPDKCNRCQEIANMKQTTFSDWTREQKTIEYFNGN